MKQSVPKHCGGRCTGHCGLIAKDVVERIEIFLCKKYELLLRSLGSNDAQWVTGGKGTSPYEYP